MNDILRFRNMIMHLIQTDPTWDDKIPDTWYKLKETLEDLFMVQNIEYIENDEFYDYIKDVDIDANYSDTVKRALHELGICLCYDKIVGLHTYVLNPNWISYGVYKILNWLGAQKKYQLSINDFYKVFSSEADIKRYPNDKYDFLYKLIIYYELAYARKHDDTYNENEKILFLPSMMSEKRPERNMETAYPIKDSF